MAVQNSALYCLYYKPTNMLEAKAKTDCQQRIFNVGAFLASPLAILGVALDTIAGTIIGIAATIFCKYSLRKKAENLLDHSHSSCMPFYAVLNILHTQPEIKIKNSKSKFMDAQELNGPLTEAISGKIKTYAKENADRTDSNFRRHVVSRLSFLLFAVASVVTRVFDTVIGAVAFVLAVVRCAKEPYFNHYALRGLKVTGVISDVVYAVLKFINPLEKTKDELSPTTAARVAAASRP